MGACGGRLETRCTNHHGRFSIRRRVGSSLCQRKRGESSRARANSRFKLMIQAHSRRLPALTALREEDMSPKCDASSRRKLGGPVVGEFQLGIRARSSEPVGRQLKAVIVWDDVGHWRSVYMPAILKIERSQH